MLPSSLMEQRPEFGVRHLLEKLKTDPSDAKALESLKAGGPEVISALKREFLQGSEKGEDLETIKKALSLVLSAADQQTFLTTTAMNSGFSFKVREAAVLEIAKGLSDTYNSPAEQSLGVIASATTVPSVVRLAAVTQLTAHVEEPSPLTVKRLTAIVSDPTQQSDLRFQSSLALSVPYVSGQIEDRNFLKECQRLIDKQWAKTFASDESFAKAAMLMGRDQWRRAMDELGTGQSPKGADPRVVATYMVNFAPSKKISEQEMHTAIERTVKRNDLDSSLRSDFILGLGTIAPKRVDGVVREILDNPELKPAERTAVLEGIKKLAEADAVELKPATIARLGSVIQQAAASAEHCRQALEVAAAVRHPYVLEQAIAGAKQLGGASFPGEVFTGVVEKNRDRLDPTWSERVAQELWNNNETRKDLVREKRIAAVALAPEAFSSAIIAECNASKDPSAVNEAALLLAHGRGTIPSNFFKSREVRSQYPEIAISYYLHSKDPAAGAFALEQMRAHKPHQSSNLHSILKIVEQERPEHAIAELKSFRDRADPKDTFAIRDINRVLGRMGDKEHALEYLRNAADKEASAAMILEGNPGLVSASVRLLSEDKAFDGDLTTSAHQFRSAMSVSAEAMKDVKRYAMHLSRAAESETDQGHADLMRRYASALTQCETLGITKPFRYTPQFLIDAVEARNDGPRKRGEEDKVAIVAVARGDESGALHQISSLADLRKNGYRVMLFEVDVDMKRAEKKGDFSLERALKEGSTDLETGKRLPADAIFIVGHGSTSSLSLGTFDPRLGLNSGGAAEIDLKDVSKLQRAKFGSALKEGGTVATISCSVGWGEKEQGNIVNMLREVFPHAGVGKIYGAQAPTMFKGLEFDERRELKGIRYTVPAYLAARVERSDVVA